MSRKLLAIAIVTLVFGSSPSSAANPLQLLDIEDPLWFQLTPSLVSPVYTYRWNTHPGSVPPTDVRHIMVNTQAFGSYAAAVGYVMSTPNAPEWSSWSSYTPPSIGTSWTSPPLDLGNYVFAVQGRDQNGVTEALEEARNMRRISIRAYSNGPLLTVTGDLIEPIVTSTVGTPQTEITVVAGTPVQFCWNADASAYGAAVTGYRYAWDLTDPDDESQWETGFTPLPPGGTCSISIQFGSGSHLFHVEVIDNNLHKSRAPILVHVDTDLQVQPSTWGRVKALYFGTVSSDR